MIRIYAPGPLEERLLTEALTPLRVPFGKGEGADEERPPVLAVIWVADESDSLPPKDQHARRSILILPAGHSSDGTEADIIITRPFRPGIVTDRARTLLARAAGEGLPEQISVGIYDFYPRENTVHHKKTKEILRLTDKERDIILTLYDAGGKAVSRQALLDSVWAYAPDVETHTLETHIYRLRQKIEVDPAAPSIILTDETGYKILTD